MSPPSLPSPAQTRRHSLRALSLPCPTLRGSSCSMKFTSSSGLPFPTPSTLDLLTVRTIIILASCPLLIFQRHCRDASRRVLRLNQDPAVSGLPPQPPPPRPPFFSGFPQLPLQLQRILVLLSREYVHVRKHNAYLCAGYRRYHIRSWTDPAGHPRNHQIHRPFVRHWLVHSQDRHHDGGRCHYHENKCRFPFPPRFGPVLP